MRPPTRLFESLFKFLDPPHPRNRAWARNADLPQIHERALRVFSDQVEDALLQLSISVSTPRSAPGAGSLTAWLASLLAHRLRIVAANTINFVHARNAQVGPGSLETTLLLLERLTITVHLTVDPERVSAILKSRGVRLEDIGADPLKAFGVSWIKWCLSSPGRDLWLIEEYDHVYNALQALTREARVTTPSARWEMFRTLASGGTLRLGSLSFEIPQQFWHAVNPDWAPSELTEGLLALRHRGVKRGLDRSWVKSALHLQRLERDIGEAWARYGQWLAEAPGSLREVETRLSALLPF